jgi:hypothetical protein
MLASRIVNDKNISGEERFTFIQSPSITLHIVYLPPQFLFGLSMALLIHDRDISLTFEV